MSETADCVVIGAGPAGYSLAIRLARYNKKVVVVEQASVGGTCLNRGCIPVKALLHAAGIVHHASEAQMMGIVFEKPKIDLMNLGKWQRGVVKRLRRGIEFLFRESKVDLRRGKAQLISPNTVLVRTIEGDTLITAKNIVLATGSEPIVYPNIKPDHQRIIDSNSALNIQDLPQRLVIIGGGAIGLEFATLFQRLGVKVQVWEMCDSILPALDKDITGLLQRQMEREGVEFQLGVKGVLCQLDDNHNSVKVCQEGKEPVFADKVLVAIGRRANTAGLRLKEIGVEMDGQGFVKTDINFQTNIKGVYAIGDVRGGPLLAHKAMFEGSQLAELLTGRLEELSPDHNFRVVPLVVYTDPEVATVGLTERACEKQGLKFLTAKVPVRAVGRAWTLNRSEGWCKIIASADTHRILGVTLIAPQADVLITEAALAVELGLTAEQIARVIHPHPTMSELLFETSTALLGRAIHIVNRV